MADNDAGCGHVKIKSLNDDESKFQRNKSLTHDHIFYNNPVTNASPDEAEVKHNDETFFTYSNSAAIVSINVDIQENQAHEERLRAWTTNLSRSDVVTLRSKKPKRMRRFSSPGDFSSDMVSFEEAFSKHEYAGSFRLRFRRDNLVAQENQATLYSNGTTESASLELLDDIELPNPSAYKSPQKLTVEGDSDDKITPENVNKMASEDVEMAESYHESAAEEDMSRK